MQGLRAAEAGLGVGLGLFPMIHPWIARGQLVAPWTSRWPTHQHLWLVTRRHLLESEGVLALKRWLEGLYVQIEGLSAGSGTASAQRRRPTAP